ncbi:Mitotic checkpoint protein [Gracilaria domingensis]|nr:Mitotic checkpoint protein [Gracilaria domingensis]
MDDDTSASPSDKAWLRVSDTIRSLQSDVRVLQDPAVRSALQTPPAAPRTPAELNAKIVSLRTELNHRDQKLKEEKEATLAARQRAARAEGELEALHRQNEETSNLHERAVSDATSRIEELETQLSEKDASIRMQRVRQRDERERGRISDTSFASEREMLTTQIQMAEAKVKRLEREVVAEKDRNGAEQKELKDKYDWAYGYAKRLQKEIELLSNTRSSFGEFRDANTAELRNKNVALESEVFRMRSQLRDESVSRTRMEARLAELEAENDRLRELCRNAQQNEEQSKYMNEEITLLRIQASEEEQAVRNASALQSEKEELARLITAISPTGDAQEGIQILRSLADDAGVSKSTDIAQRIAAQKYEVQIAEIEQQHSTKLLMLQDELDDCHRSIREMKNKSIQLQEDKETASAQQKRSERGRRILQREVDHLKAALREIEEDEMGATSQQIDSRLRRRLEEAEKMSSEYRLALANVEAELEAKRSQIGEMRLKSIEGFESRASTDQRFPAVGDLKHQLESELSRRRDAEKNVQSLNAQLKNVQRKLEEFQAEYAVLPPDMSAPDYDSTKVKALHLVDNPLAKALREHAVSNIERKQKAHENLDEDVDMCDESNTELTNLKVRISQLQQENEQLSKDSKVGLRTKEIAMKKIEEVRGAVYHLFGWSMRLAGAKYTLGSLYAESQNEILEFGRNENGTFALMETHYTNQLTEEIEQYVQKMNSIPGFLAHITMENLEKTTLMNV